MANLEDITALPFLGRRTERLIFTGVLLIILCFVEAFLATANRQISEDRSIDVLNGLIERIAKNEESLSELFQAKDFSNAKDKLIQEKNREDAVHNTRLLLGLPPAPPKDSDESLEPQTYRAALIKIIGEVAPSSFREIFERKYVNYDLSPTELRKSLRAQLKEIENTSTTVWGIRTPNIFQLQYAGREYQFPFSFVSGALEVALAPLIIGWLGALYATRQREILLIIKLDNYKYAFPYILNYLPVQFSPLKSIDRSSRLLMSFNRNFLSGFRALVMLTLTAPLLTGFLYSLVMLEAINPSVPPALLIMGIVVTLIMLVQVLGLVFQELLLLKDKLFYES